MLLDDTQRLWEAGTLPSLPVPFSWDLWVACTHVLLASAAGGPKGLRNHKEQAAPLLVSQPNAGRPVWSDVAFEIPSHMGKNSLSQV